MNTLRNYIELTKPRIAVMVLVTTVFGYGVAGGSFSDWWLLACTLLGTAGAGGGASVLNQYIERDVDAKMDRTRNRPIPSGDISPQAALFYGVVLACGGVLFLLWQVNILAAFLALQSTFLYVLVYTPMKRLSWWNTSVGAIPGAIPPLIGWAAATGSLNTTAWVLFGILYIWQHPHFFAIAWMYRDDYRKGGFKMLSVVKPDGKSMFAQIIGFSVLLIPVSLLPTLLGSSGAVYFSGALLAGIGMLAYSVLFAQRRNMQSARGLLRASLVYLPVLLMFVVVDAAL